MSRDPFREVLSRILPWFDQAAYDRERDTTRRVLAQADRVLQVREAYRLTAQRVEGRG